MPLPGPDPMGELGDTVSSITSLDVGATLQNFHGLTPNSPYQIVICAFTNTGCGVNVTMNQTTNGDGN